MPAYPIVLRAASQDDKVIPFCNPDALDWSVIVFVFLAVSLSWWIYEIPAVWRDGMREFLRRLVWGALRVHAPGSVGILTLLRCRRNPVDWPKFYYFGVESPNDGEIVELTRWQYAKIALYEVPVVVATILCAYRWSLMESDSWYPQATGAWISGSLPSMVIGTTLLLASRIRWKHISLVYLSAFVALVAVAAAYALGIYYGARLTKGLNADGGILFVICNYVVVMLPWLFVVYCCVPFTVRAVICAAAVLLRSFAIVLLMDSLPGRELGPVVDDQCTSATEGLIFSFIPFGVIAFVLVVRGIGKFDHLLMNRPSSGRPGTLWVGLTPPTEPAASNIENRPGSPAQDAVPQTDTDTEALLPPPGPPPRYETYASPPPPYIPGDQPSSREAT